MHYKHDAIGGTFKPETLSFWKIEVSAAWLVLKAIVHYYYIEANICFVAWRKQILKRIFFSDHISFDLTIKLVYDVKFWDNVDLENCKQTWET